MNKRTVEKAGADMARGALAAIQDLLDDGGIPRGTFGDEQVQNLVALYNQRGDEIERLRAACQDVSAMLHAANRPSLPAGLRIRCRDRLDEVLTHAARAGDGT